MDDTKYIKDIQGVTMLSNQFENIILEYKQDITARKMGEPLIQRFMADANENPSILTPKTKKLVDAIQDIELGPLEYKAGQKKKKNQQF